MPYELVSRTLAILSCLSTLCLAMTSVAYAAVNVGKMRPLHGCGTAHCAMALTAKVPPGLTISAPVRFVKA